jgi:RNA polymerase primary sigma factor
VTSLDRPVGEEGEGQLGDLVAGPGQGPEEELSISLREESLRRAMSRLPEREAEILALRYGMDGGGARTLAQVGEMLGLSRERVRQLEKDALRQLSVARELEGLDEAV